MDPSIVTTEPKQIIIIYTICTFEDKTITLRQTVGQAVTRRHIIEESRAKQLRGLKIEGKLGYPLPREKTGSKGETQR